MSKASNALLALLLTLPEVEPPLTTEEQTSLNDVGYRLNTQLNWESDIEPILLEIVQGRPAWNQRFTETKAKLDDLGDDIPHDLLPTPEELKQVLPPSNAPATLGDKPGVPDSKDDRIDNTTISILKTTDPSQTAREVKNRFGKLWEFLTTPIL